MAVKDKEKEKHDSEQESEKPAEGNNMLQQTAEPENDKPKKNEAFSRLRLFFLGLWFSFWNWVYRQLYYVGAQLLRTTRVRRRHFTKTAHKLRGFLAGYWGNRRYRVRRTWHRIWWRMTVPLREVKTQRAQFKRDLFNARLYHTKVGVLGVYLRMLWHLIKMLFRFVRSMMNYILPVAAIWVLVFTVQNFDKMFYAYSTGDYQGVRENGAVLALRVEYNGQEVGYVTDESVFTQAENDVKNRIFLDRRVDLSGEEESKVATLDSLMSEVNNGTGITNAVVPRFELVVVDGEVLVGADELANNLIWALRANEDGKGLSVQEAEGLYIDGEFVGALSNGSQLLQYLDSQLERYRSDDLGEDATIQFIKKIQLKKGLFPSETVVPYTTVYGMLSQEERGEKRYTVVEGDNPSRIAMKNGITIEELEAMNPSVSTSLFVGDELIISQPVPYLGVQVLHTTRIQEDIPYQITQRVDVERPAGTTETVQQGRVGVRESVVQIKMIDGVEVERTVLGSTIMEQPVHQVLIVGGLRENPFIGSDSHSGIPPGSFGWPADGGSINMPYGGYPGHTGADITFSGIFGTPVRASADGIVVVAKYGPGYGNHIIIEHGGGIQTLYAHCNTLTVGVGQEVSRGEQIGTVGRTGWATGPHVHLEIRINGTAVNPAPYL